MAKIMSENQVADLVSKVKAKANASTTYTKTEVDGAISTAVDALDIPTVVQTKGQSTTDVMSQKAVTDLIYDNDNIKIAGRSVSIGDGATVLENGSVAIGANSFATRVGEVNVSTSDTMLGYNNSTERVIGGVHDGVMPTDAATVGQLNTAIAGVTPPTVVHDAGRSTTDVMSQKAVTDLLFPRDATGGVDKSTVAIGNTASAATGGTAIGSGAKTKEVGDIAIEGDLSNASGQGNVAIGQYSSVTGGWSVAIGRSSWADRNYEFSVGSPGVPRMVSNVLPGVRQTDAANITQGNKILGSRPTSSTEGTLGQLITYAHSAAGVETVETYQCTSVDRTDPDNVVYTWTKRW